MPNGRMHVNTGTPSPTPDKNKNMKTWNENHFRLITHLQAQQHTPQTFWLLWYFEQFSFCITRKPIYKFKIPNVNSTTYYRVFLVHFKLTDRLKWIEKWMNEKRRNLYLFGCNFGRNFRHVFSPLRNANNNFKMKNNIDSGSLLLVRGCGARKKNAKPNEGKPAGRYIQLTVLTTNEFTTSKNTHNSQNGSSSRGIRHT